jgi:hypothetical protein
MFNAIYIWLAILGNNSYLHSCWFFLSEDSINKMDNEDFSVLDWKEYIWFDIDFNKYDCAMSLLQVREKSLKIPKG